MHEMISLREACVCSLSIGIISYTYNKTSCFEYIKFITEDYFTEHMNITTKLKWKLFTKVIKIPSEESLGWIDRESK